VLVLGGVAGLGAMAKAMSFQLTRQSVLSVWDPGGLRPFNRSHRPRWSRAC